MITSTRRGVPLGIAVRFELTEFGVCFIPTRRRLLHNIVFIAHDLAFETRQPLHAFFGHPKKGLKDGRHAIYQR